MITIYELLEVEEDASKEEIEKAYSRMVLEFRQDIKFDEETNKENEMILNKLKIAYEILTDDAKRKKYDYDLAQKRAENLLKSVSIPQEEPAAETVQPVQNETKPENMDIPPKQEVVQKQEVIQKQEVVKKQEPIQKSNVVNSSVAEKKVQKQAEGLTKDEKDKIRKAAQNEFNQKLKRVQQAEAEYNEAYNKAYNDYMRKMGYKVKEPWTFKRVKNLVITILAVIIAAVIMWYIPPIRKMLTSLYEENFIIKAIVDLVKAVIDTILRK